MCVLDSLLFVFITISVFEGFFLLFSGQFTLRDMYEQFQNIMKMGPFSQIMVRKTEATEGTV